MPTDQLERRAKLKDPIGVMDSLSKRHGWLTSVDADDGSVKWRYRAGIAVGA